MPDFINQADVSVCYHSLLAQMFLWLPQTRTKWPNPKPAITAHGFVTSVLLFGKCYMKFESLACVRG